MKKALVLTIVCALGLGFATLAASPFTGTWSATIAMDPDAALLSDFFSVFEMSLALDYTIGGWTFGSTTTFADIGWSKQSFAADGVMGAFSFSSVMNFQPMAITAVDCHYPQTWSAVTTWLNCWFEDSDLFTYKYAPDFDDWKTVGTITIAGVSIEGTFFLEGFGGNDTCDIVAWLGPAVIGNIYTQTSGSTNFVLPGAATPVVLGSGARIVFAATTPDFDITSYTYFNLTEKFTKVLCGYSLTPGGTLKVATADCVLRFTSEYLLLEGVTFGCLEFDAGLRITCAGFDWVAVETTVSDLLFPGLDAVFQIKFTESAKTVALCLDLSLASTCLEFGVTVDYTPYGIDGFTFDSVGFEYEWNGVTFSSTTLFSGCIEEITDDAFAFSYLVPIGGITNTAGDVLPSIVDSGTGLGYYVPHCAYLEKYCVWEEFTLGSTSDSCCGGAFEFSVTTQFGNKLRLTYYGWDYSFFSGLADDPLTLLIDESWPVLNQDQMIDSSNVMAGDPLLVWWEVFGFDTIDEYWDALDAIMILGTPADLVLIGDIYAVDATGSLFGWIATQISVSAGISSSFGLTFGLDIDVYGWNAVSVGFEFSF